MTRLTWEARDYEVGADRGVFYPPVGAGEAWSGLISVTETPVDSSLRTKYQDGRKFVNQQSKGYFAGKVEAYSYPPSFYADVMTQRRQKAVGFSYRTMTKDHYRLHLVYNAIFSPGGYSHEQSVFETYSWGFTTLPIDVPNAERSSHLIIETSIAYPVVLESIEDLLYGTEGDYARLPSPQEIFDIFEENSIVIIVDHGDGTWSAIGPDEAVYMVDLETFEINWPSAVYIDADSYTVSSL